MMKICIVIPAHNEIGQIGAVVESLARKNLSIVVIDDGSTDGTGDLAQQKGAQVIRHSQKRGKGYSLQEGFTYSVDKGFDGVIAMDGDGQHDVADVDAFLTQAEQNPDSIISGNRMEANQNMPWLRRLTNEMMSYFISKICKQNIPDTQCGFRYIGSKVLQDISLSSRDFEIETEGLIQASKKGYPVFSVPVKTIYNNEKSKINPFIDTIRFFIYILRELCSSSRR